MNLFNYHTHTHYCDGSSEPESYIKKAIEKDFSALGFSAHAPIDIETKWSLKHDNINKYLNEINRLKELYSKQIEIFLGFETDYFPGLTPDFEFQKQKYQLDYIIGSVHLVKSNLNNDFWFIDGPEENYINGLAKIFNNNIKIAVSAYFNQICEMITTQQFDILGHFDKIKMNNKNRFFEEKESWYQALIKQTIQIIEKSNCIVEVNTRGIYKKRSESLFPSVEILEQLYLKEIPVLISTDAHAPEELDFCYKETFEIIKSIGFKHLSTLNSEGIWTKIKI